MSAKTLIWRQINPRNVVIKCLWYWSISTALKQLQWAFIGMSFSFILTSNIWMTSWINVIYVDLSLNKGVISSSIIFKTISCSLLVTNYLIHVVRQNVFFCVIYVWQKKEKKERKHKLSVCQSCELDLSSICCKVVFSTVMVSSHVCCLSVIKTTDHNHFSLWSVVG